jgi:hypothetical protein
MRSRKTESLRLFANRVHREIFKVSAYTHLAAWVR